MVKWFVCTNKFVIIERATKTTKAISLGEKEYKKTKKKKSKEMNVYFH